MNDFGLHCKTCRNSTNIMPELQPFVNQWFLRDLQNRRKCCIFAPAIRESPESFFTKTFSDAEHSNYVR